MLGEVLGEERGKVTVYRVLPPEGGASKVEVSFQSSGTLLGIAETSIATYWSMVRPDGTLFGEGHGIVTGEGGESATWIGNGVGKMAGKGSRPRAGVAPSTTRQPRQSGHDLMASRLSSSTKRTRTEIRLQKFGSGGNPHQHHSD